MSAGVSSIILLSPLKNRRMNVAPILGRARHVPVDGACESIDYYYYYYYNYNYYYYYYYLGSPRPPASESRSFTTRLSEPEPVAARPAALLNVS